MLDVDGEEVKIDPVSSDLQGFDPRSAMFTENYSAEAKAPSGTLEDDHCGTLKWVILW